MTPEDAYGVALKRIERVAIMDEDELDLSRLGLNDIPPEVFKLVDLEILDLEDNNLAAIPPMLGSLTNLRELYLSDNQITALPGELDKLINLYELHLSGNMIAAIPSILGKLTSLRELHLDENKITTIPSTLATLTNLHTLYLNGNRITVLTDTLGKLTNLRKLELSDNQIAMIPDTLGDLTNLERLSLTHNELIALPDSLRGLTHLRRLYLHGNPMLGIPAEVLGPTAQDRPTGELTKPSDILEYYFRTRKNERPLNEAKLILVGRGAVGKTSLAKRLIFNTFDPKETKTQGINIDRWEVPIESEQVRLNVWDFGGQEIMHATHQFFLTERSLYLLVLNGRDGGEDAEAEYWLKLIGSFGGNSPVIMVLNKISEHAFDLNRNALLKKYPNIKGFIKTDCEDDTGVEQLKEAIFKETSDLDELRVNFPAEWFAVKDLLASSKENYLGFARYRELCAKNGVKDEKDQDLLARFLNQLGIVLNYKDDTRLKDTHVLNPHWVTQGIYKILNSKRLEENHGEIRLDDLSGILPEKEYPVKMVQFIFDLMKKFDLCFSFPDDEQHYLIPELLPKNEPEEAEGFDPEKSLNFQYHYPVLPEGVLPRFITRTHHLSEERPRWRSGVILQFEGCRALVKADAVDRKVLISIDGTSPESRRRLLAVVRTEFERIHREIKNLDPREMVPLPGLPDEMEPYNNLLVIEAQGMTDFPKVVGTEVKTFKIGDLLNGVDLPGYKKEKMPEAEGVSLLYSYAHEDERYKDVLETHLKILQRQGTISTWSDREIGAGENWREEIMNELARADIILLLISSDFLASDFCYDVEMKRAMERDTNKEARVIPVIVRDCIWTKAPFAKLQALPKDGRPVKSWPDKDKAWRNVAEGIEKAADNFRKKPV
jgi:internalin A